MSDSGERVEAVGGELASPPGQGIILHAAYDIATRDLANSQWNACRLRFDEARSSLAGTWKSLIMELGQATLSQATLENTASQLIASQTIATGLALGIARLDSEILGDDLWRYLELTANLTDKDAGYVSVAEIPPLVGGFVYMSAAIAGIVHRSWSVLRRLFGNKLEFASRSSRPVFTYGFDARPFFHSEAMSRSATRTHDLYRKLMKVQSVGEIIGVPDEDLLTAYVQTQFLMCIRAAQLAERQEFVRVFADFGRFYAERLMPLIDRSHADVQFGERLAGVFGETRDQWFARLNERIAYVKQNYWGNTPHFYESLDYWQPR